MIREGTPEDFDQILPLCERFWQETEFDDPFHVEQSEIMLNMCYEHGLLAVLDINGIQGFVCGVKSPLLGNKYVTVGTELAWWVNPEHRSGKNGVGLLKFIEDLAKRQGIKYWCMVSLESSMPKKVGEMYKKMGYHLSEKTYMRCLWPQSHQQ